MIPEGTPIAARQVMTTHIAHNRQPNELAGVPPAGIKNTGLGGRPRPRMHIASIFEENDLVVGSAASCSHDRHRSHVAGPRGVHVAWVYTARRKVSRTKIQAVWRARFGRPHNRYLSTRRCHQSHRYYDDRAASKYRRRAHRARQFEAREISSNFSCWTISPHETAELILNGPLAGMDPADIARDRRLPTRRLPDPSR